MVLTPSSVYMRPLEPDPCRSVSVEVLAGFHSLESLAQFGDLRFTSDVV